MYSHHQNEHTENSYCVKVSGDKFPVIHWEPNTDFWACNVKAVSSKNKISEATAQANPNLSSSSEELSLETNLNDSSASSHLKDEILQFEKQTSNGNSVLPYSCAHEFGGTQIYHGSPFTHANLNSGNRESSLASNFDLKPTSSPISEQQIRSYQHTPNGNFILRYTRSNMVDNTQIGQGFPVRLQRAQPIQISYQHNRPSHMSAYIIPGQSNGFMSRNYQNNRNMRMHGNLHLTHAPFIKSSSGLLRTNKAKLKRKRTMFTTEQVAVLEKAFFKKPYVNREERLSLVDQLHVDEKTIKVWFQNRRLKDKRDAAELEDDMYTSDSLNTATMKETSSFCRFDRLLYVESLLTQADERGFVTLDDRALSDLAAVIDDILPKDIQLIDVKNNEVETEVQCTNNCSNIYEPISPAEPDSYNNDEPSITQDLLEPKEALQRLLDLESIINLDCS